jgi:hypothetical protein
MIQFSPKVLVASVFGYAVFEYFNTKKDAVGKFYEQIQRIQEKSVHSFPCIRSQMDAIVKLSNCERRTFDDCYSKLNDLITNFSNRFPDLYNLEKFG